MHVRLTSWGNVAVHVATTIPRKAEKFAGILKDLCRHRASFMGGRIFCAQRRNRVRAEERVVYVCRAPITERSFLQRTKTVIKKIKIWIQKTNLLKSNPTNLFHNMKIAKHNISILTLDLEAEIQDSAQWYFPHRYDIAIKQMYMVSLMPPPTLNMVMSMICVVRRFRTEELGFLAESRVSSPNDVMLLSSLWSGDVPSRFLVRGIMGVKYNVSRDPPFWARRFAANRSELRTKGVLDSSDTDCLLLRESTRTTESTNEIPVVRSPSPHYHVTSFQPPPNNLNQANKSTEQLSRCLHVDSLWDHLEMVGKTGQPSLCQENFQTSDLQ